MTNHNYVLHVTENELTTSINVGRRQPMQVTTAQKEDHAMVYVWESCEKKIHEFRCTNMAEAHDKAWDIARRLGRNEAIT